MVTGKLSQNMSILDRSSTPEKIKHIIAFVTILSTKEKRKEILGGLICS